LRKLLLTTCALLLVAGAGQASSFTHARREWHLGKWEPGYHNVVNAIYYEFCGHKYRYCSPGHEAYRVSHCETGGTFSVWATNGQYLGIFQMGYHERMTYGYGRSPWDQAKGAHKYYVKAGGWGPWSCKP
jgi:hypothetical protein